MNKHDGFGKKPKAKKERDGEITSTRDVPMKKYREFSGTTKWSTLPPTGLMLSFPRQQRIFKR
jgi:hypothetical protein